MTKLVLSLATLLGVYDDAAEPAPEESTSTADVIVVVGRYGADEYAEMFQTWAQRWVDAAARGRARCTLLGTGEDQDDYEQLRNEIGEHAIESNRPLWLVMIGHGTYDGREAKFNLDGPDVSAQELWNWLAGAQRPVAVINCASSSGAFIEHLSNPGWIVVTSTKSGDEINFARFGDYLSSAIADQAADFDKDGQVSLLEAFLAASRRTEEFYRGDDERLLTEHALIDDDGDGAGTRAAAFEGVRPTRDTETGALDGFRAHQWHLIPSEQERSFPAELRPVRDELELAVFQLRELKTDLPEEEYFARLESLLVQLAEVYEQAESVESGIRSADSETDSDSE
jgi:hypothetical protein